METEITQSTDLLFSLPLGALLGRPVLDLSLAPLSLLALLPLSALALLALPLSLLVSLLALSPLLALARRAARDLRVLGVRPDAFDAAQVNARLRNNSDEWLHV